MVVLKVLGWIFIPYIMLGFQWNKIGSAGKAIGSVWSVIALFSVIGASSTNKPKSPTAAIPVAVQSSPEEQAKNEEIKKAQEEADALEKAKADKKSKEEAAAREKAEQEEKKRKEEEEAKEEAKKQAELEKIKYALFAKISIPTVTDGLKLQDKTYNYIVANSTLFPAKDAKQIKAAQNKVDGKIKYGHLEKNVTPYLDKMIAVKGQVVSVEEQPAEGDTIAFLHLMDDNFNSYRVLICKTTGDIIKGDTVKAIGVPVGAESFKNVSGGTTNSIFLFGSHIAKVQ